MSLKKEERKKSEVISMEISMARMSSPRHLTLHRSLYAMGEGENKKHTRKPLHIREC